MTETGVRVAIQVPFGLLYRPERETSSGLAGSRTRDILLRYEFMLNSCVEGLIQAFGGVDNVYAAYKSLPSNHAGQQMMTALVRYGDKVPTHLLVALCEWPYISADLPLVVAIADKEAKDGADLG